MSIVVHLANPTGSLTGSFNFSDIISTLVDNGDCVCSLRMKSMYFPLSNMCSGINVPGGKVQIVFPNHLIFFFF